METSFLCAAGQRYHILSAPPARRARGKKIDGAFGVALGIPEIAGQGVTLGGGEGRGAVYVLLLNTTGTVKVEQKISDTQGGFTATLDEFDYFGWSVVGVGDVNGGPIPEKRNGIILNYKKYVN